MADSGDEGVPWDSTVWFGLAIVGAFVFVLGIWVPAFSFVLPRDRSYVQMAVAALGGALAILGLSYGFDARARENDGRRPRRRSSAPAGSVRGAPSFEVYDPRLLPPPGSGGGKEPPTERR